MKKIINIVTFVLVLCMLLAQMTACTIQPGYEGAPEGMRPINEGDEGAILYVPSGWSVETSTGVPTAYYSSNDRSMITLITVSRETVGSTDPKSYWESYREGFASAMTDFQIVKENESDPDYTTRLIAGEGCYIYTFSAKVAELDYKFRQALLKNPSTGCLYIITYSASANLFDKHLDELDDVYDNFRFVTESIPMKDKTEIEVPSEEGTDIPEGMKLISSSFTDYLFFVDKAWIPMLTTGMTAAHDPNSPAKSVSIAVFSTDYENLDDYWTGYEKDLINTFGEITFASQETKYSETMIDGYEARVYTYSAPLSGSVNCYAQYILIRSGYVYIVTCTADTFDDALEIRFELKLS